MKAKLTERQRQVVDFIKAYRKENKINPSLQEIGEHLGITRSRIAQIFTDLVIKGWIERDYRPRLYKLL